MKKKKPLKILHTSDWHLGQKFMGKSREEEHQAFLSWLLETIKKHNIDTLIIAGDIFDTGTPPNYALELYYTFFKDLQKTPCTTTIVVAGNHDSIATLNAPKEVLKIVDVHVISSGEESDDERIIKLYDNEKNLAGVVCAVPFLRDGVIRKGLGGQSYEEKEMALVVGMQNYYNNIADLAQNALDGNRDIPVITTGHFTTVGGKVSDSERDLYIGNTMNIPSGFLAERFDYVALGHLHKSQKVGDTYEHVRYSGSPIPLSFSEANNQKKVTIITFEGVKRSIQEVDIPLFRKLYRLKGSKEEILQSLQNIGDKEGWVEIEISDDDTYTALQEIQTYADENNIVILAKKIARSSASAKNIKMQLVDLDTITPFEIFQKRLELDAMDDAKLRDKLIQRFKEIEEEIVTI
ncbi:exonuclease SbcCD subunit D C-terminal domain-containing protein [Sulfurimonas sp. NW15]|uniref:exonuclease SbcCD subunit D C-terminal domain-containing protein n=1 Tax=unclassified Sulfurimonas TaxID=2623549 RepID=UPI003DA82A16